MVYSASIHSIASAAGHLLTEEKASLLGHRLDRDLEEMIEKLEKASSCQQSGPSSVALEEVPAFAAFCAGLESIANRLVPHFRTRYLDHCKDQDISPETAKDLYRARVQALIHYLQQVAQVHGLAFEGAPKQIGAFEKGVLASFEAKLWMMSAL